MNVKKALALLLSLCMALSLAACGGGGGNSDAASGDSGSKAAGEVSIFYYTFNDTYLSSVRSAMDAALSAAGVNFNNYDGNNIQTTQTDSIDTAIAKGASILAVNLVDTGSNDAAQNIVDKAKAQSIPVVFFNRSVEESVVSSYDNCAFVGTDYTQAGKMQGDMIGQSLVENYDAVDLNGDGVISYVMFKGDEANQEAIYRTQYGQENADAILAEAGKPALKFYDDTNANRYLVDQNGAWSAQAATDYMQTILSQYSEANNNMVELVIANNDEMALGAIAALQNAGYNSDGKTVIPVFGVDATDAARAAIDAGSMIGTIKQDAEGMANAIVTIITNFQNGTDKFDGIDPSYLEGTWRVNIPYSVYTGE